MIIDDSGIILTNNHVVAGGGTVIVRTYDGREFTASEVLTDPSTDIAVVKIKGADNLTAAPMGDSDRVEVGDWVLALGQPFGLESTVTAGIISAKHRGIRIAARADFLQTDAAINPGNSGGPLVNLRGEIVGINTAISSRGGGNDGVGFSVPSNLVGWVADQLIESGEVKRAYLGVQIQEIDADLARTLNMPPRSGVLVNQVMDDTPAAKIGLREGDVIVRFNNRAVRSPSELQLAVEQSTFGTQVPVKVNRDGKVITLDYAPVERPRDFDTASSPPPVKNEAPAVEMNKLGVSVEMLTDETAKALGLDEVEGVVITKVRPGGPADQAGLAEGTVIKQLSRTPITSVEQFEKLVSESKGDLLALVEDARGSRFVVLKR